jgi:Meckel syndrome type 1 protein
MPKAPSAPDTAAQLASAVAVADVPRRMANARRGSGQAPRATTRAHQRASTPVQAVAALEVATATPAGNPFSTRHALPASRPWPRALVPGMPASGAFTVDYGGNTAPAPSFFPFEPARLQPQRVDPAAADNP